MGYLQHEARVLEALGENSFGECLEDNVDVVGVDGAGNVYDDLLFARDNTGEVLHLDELHGLFESIRSLVGREGLLQVDLANLLLEEIGFVEEKDEWLLLEPFSVDHLLKDFE